jgi:hypothetical protein
MALVFTAGGLSLPVMAAQEHRAAPKPARAAPAPRAAPNAPRKTPQGIPGRPLERFENMTPEQREKALSRLPPERRADIERRLNRLERLPAEQRAELQQRYQRFQSLPVERRVAVRSELQNLRTMPPAMRRQRLNDPGFQQQYSPEEQALLRESLGQKPQ